MQSEPPNSTGFAIFIDPETGLPIPVPVENADEWKNPEGELQLFNITQALIAHGFEGVVFKLLATFPNGRFMYALSLDSNSPEGKYIAAKREMVRTGQQLPEVDAALQAVRTAYRLAGLPLPSKGTQDDGVTR